MAEARLYTYYKNDVIPRIVEEFQYESKMAVPKLEKIIVNAGVSDAINDSKILDNVAQNIAYITGQRPVITRAKRSISNFKLRQGMPIGCKVTLRGKVMYEFLDRLINLALPRTRDFQGVPDKSFDGRGNYSMGIVDHTIFPEINTDNVDQIHGMDLTFVTNVDSDAEAYSLLKHLGMPFQRRN